MQTINIILYSIATIILIRMAIEDWYTMTVPEWLCNSGLIFAAIVSIILSRYPVAIIFVFVFILCFFLLPEFTFFGDADYVPLALYMAFYARKGFFSGLNCLPFVIAMIMLLFALYPTACLYYRSKHKRYQLFQGMYVPLLPAVAVAWCLTPIPLLISYLGGFYNVA